MRGLTILLLALAGFAQAQTQDVLGSLREQGLGFAQVTPGNELQFPRDHGAHPDYRIEWWYLTANLSDGDGRQWGLQWTLFRQALDPQQAAGWQSNQVWMAHAAITTPDGHFHEQRFARGGIGQAGVRQASLGSAEAPHFNAWIDDWEWRARGLDPFPATLRFTVGERDIVLLVESAGDPVKNGIDGFSQKSAQGQASYYYSQPHLRVRGFVSQGLAKTYLKGQGWLDREWSSQALAANQQGWDWFSLHLDDGHKLMVYQLRHDGGDHWLSGNWINPHGDAETLGRSAIELRATRRGRVDSADGESRELPLEWTLALVEQQREFRIRPLYDEQWMDTSIPYWEGVVLVEDDGGTRSGVGYMELTGYQ